MKSTEQHYHRRNFYIEGVPVEAVARQVGTPFYLYSRLTIENAFSRYQHAFRSIPHLICFALKANENLAIGRLLSRQGAGADIVSGGELKKALMAGFRPDRIVFSGVGKTQDELILALRKGIRLINVESEEELRALHQISSSIRKVAPVSLRVNPDVRAGGHPHISTGTPTNKFGVYYRQIFPLYKWAAQQRFLRPVGIQSHIGSQITHVGPYRRALTVLLDIHRDLEQIGIHLDIIDLGGGLGVDYNGNHVSTPQDLADILVPPIGKRRLTLFLEPGRSLVAQSGILVTKVLYRKDGGAKHFVMVDAAMNDLARPALYDAHHEIVPVKRTTARRAVVDVVGPVCESGDFLARNRSMPIPRPGELLAVLTAGAYGFSMSSQYNARPRVPEILVSGRSWDVIRERETFPDLIRGERIPRFLHS